MPENTLKALSNALADAVENTGTSIVRVEARRRLPATGIAWSSDVVVTAHHVVEAEEGINIGLPDGTVAQATLVGRDPNTDIAVLRITGGQVKAANWAATNDVLRVGHMVLALGRPTNNLQATLGVVSAIGEYERDVIFRREAPPGPPPGGPEIREFRRRGGRRWDAGRWWMALGGRMEGAIQTDVTMYPGFSGGPLVDAAGIVWGLNTSAIQGVSMTVPANTVRRVVETLLSHGRMRRGFLGIGAQPVRLPDALSNQLDQEIGLMLVSVEAGSPAEKGGLFIGDIIVGLDGNGVSHLEELLALLSGDRVGKEVPVQIVRGGQAQTINITIGEKS